MFSRTQPWTRCDSDFQLIVNSTFKYVILLLAAQQFSTGLGLRASCQYAAEKALGRGRSRDYRPSPFAFPINM
jgi:hypothetical protein